VTGRPEKMLQTDGTAPPKTWLSASSQQWASFLRSREEQVFLILTLVIGAIVGLVVVALILVSERFGARLYPAGGAAWRRLLVPVAGSLGMGYLLYRFFPDARGSGVPQTKAAVYSSGYTGLRTVIGKFLCTSGTLGSGLPLGREGPAVQIGGGIASVLGRRLGLRPDKVKALIPVGAAAAIAAAFNTPLAAVLFTLEEVVGDLHAPVLGSVVLASATSWVVLRLLLGNEPLFQVPQYQLAHPGEFGIYALLGVAGGFVSLAFTKLLLCVRAQFLRFQKKRAWFQPVAGGLTIGLMGWFVPQILGVGYKHVGEVLNGRFALRLMLLLLVLKLFAVVIAYASGNAGGIFGPSLFMGAMLGGIVGTLAQQYLPGYAGPPGAYALVGMGTAFAGIIRAPMTSVVMIFEITRDYAVIVPLMISNLVSFFISARFQKQTIYELLGHQDGIHLPTAETRQQGTQRQVALAMRPAEEVLRTDITVAEAMGRTKKSDDSAWVVSDKQGVRGILSRTALEEASRDGRSESCLEALLTTVEFVHLHPDHSLSVALERLGASQLELLPVVSRANVRQLEGVVTLQDVLAHYGVSSKEVD